MTESKNAHVDLPPELCDIVLSPVSISTLYSYTFIPSIMHRLESLLIAVNLKKMHSDHCMQNVDIPAMKVIYSDSNYAKCFVFWTCTDQTLLLVGIGSNYHKEVPREISFGILRNSRRFFS
jgi:hypothetical protein